MKKTFLLALLLSAFTFPLSAFSTTSTVGGVGISGSGNAGNFTIGTTTLTIGTTGTLGSMAFQPTSAFAPSGWNPFNQSLNTTSTPTFNGLTATGSVSFAGGGLTVSSAGVTWANEMDLANGFRVKGNYSWTSGKGIEFLFSQDVNTGVFFGYDRDNMVTLPIAIGTGDYVNFGYPTAYAWINSGDGSASFANAAVTIDTSGNVTANSLTGPTNSSNMTVPVTTSTATSGSVSFGSVKNDETIYFSNSSTITSITVVLPTMTKVGQICRIHSKSAITTLTLTGTLTDGATLTTLAALGTAAFQATNTTGTFIKIQ